MVGLVRPLDKKSTAEGSDGCGLANHLKILQSKNWATSSMDREGIISLCHQNQIGSGAHMNGHQ